MENNSNIDHSRLEWLIRAYQIKDNGDGRIRINIRPGEETLKVIRTHKAEIMQILHEMEAQENKQRELARKRQETIEAIPGYMELCAALEREADYREKYTAAWERGDGFLPGPSHGPSSSSIAKKHPAAAFARSMDVRRFSANSEIASIAGRAYAALGDGQDWEKVKAAFDADMAVFAEHHFWD